MHKGCFNKKKQIMIWVLLFSLIFGKSDSPLANPKHQKHIKKVVKDENRQSQILEITKKFKDDVKTLKSLSKGEARSFGKMNKNWETENEEFERIFSLVLENRRIFQEKGIDARVKITPLILDNEWNDYLMFADNAWDKEAKSRKKTLKKLNKRVDKAERVINNKITSTENNKSAINYINSFRGTLIQVKKEYSEINSYGNDILRNRHATRNELIEHAEKMNSLRIELHGSFLESRQGIKDLTTEDQWNSIAKSINNIF